MQIRICSTCCGRGHPKGCPLSFLASEILIYAIFLPLYVHFNTSGLFLLGPPSATCQSQVDNPTQLTRQKCRASFAEPRKLTRVSGLKALVCCPTPTPAAGHWPAHSPRRRYCCRRSEARNGFRCCCAVPHCALFHPQLWGEFP